MISNSTSSYYLVRCPYKIFIVYWIFFITNIYCTIIIFKDIISSDYIPGFYILMSNKTEIIYDMVFKSLKKILTQNGIYPLNIKTITTDTELALINAVNNNFVDVQRIGCWFHLKQDLLREAKVLGLLNKKTII